MIADRGNNRILMVDPQGQIVFQYPPPGAASLFFDDDTFVEPGGEYVISNEEGDHVIVQVNLRSHTQELLFGHPEEPGADAAHLKEPDDAYMLPDGTVTVADAANCRILFIRARQIVRSYGQAGTCHHDPPRFFGQVNGDTPLPGGGVLVSEIEGNWLDEIGPEGVLKWAVQAPVSYPSDPQPLPGGRVLVADYANPGHVLIIDRQGRALWRYGPSHGYGQLDHPSLAMPLPNGDVAVNDDYRDRVVVIDPRTNSVVWQFGHTDVAGVAPGYLNTPDGMDFIPAGPDGAPDFAAVIHP
jgi:DNA-binding beta-propeller fold protein YncE